MQAQRRVIIFLGPPGSGKGTQGMRLGEALAIPVISTGELLRNECRAGTDLGRQIGAILQSGQLLADSQINSMVAHRIAAADCLHGCILDGFPRTVAQAEFLDNWLEQSGGAEVTVFDFLVSVDELIERLGKRRQCPKCGCIFSTRGEPLANRMTCPNDRSLLVSRTDDQPDAIRNRLQIYQRNTGPLTKYYRRRGYHRISAAKSPDFITEELLGVLRPQSSNLTAANLVLAAHAIN